MSTIGDNSNPNLNNLNQYNVGKIKENAKDLNLKDIVEYKSKTSWLGKVISKIALGIKGKGEITSSNVDHVINGLGKEKLEELKNALGSQDQNKRGVKATLQILNSKLKKIDENNRRILNQEPKELNNNELNTANNLVLQKLIDGAPLAETEEAIFNYNPYEKLTNNENLESFLLDLSTLHNEGFSSESIEEENLFEEIKSMIDFESLNQLISEDGDISHNISTIVKDSGNIDRLTEIMKTFSSDARLTSEEIDELELSDEALEKIGDDLQKEGADALAKAQAEQDAIEIERNKPPRDREINRITTVMNRGFTNITENKWNRLEKDTTSFAKLNFYPEPYIAITGDDTIERFDAELLKEVLGKDSGYSVTDKREFLKQFISDIESTMLGEDEEAKQAANNILASIPLDYTTNLAQDIFNLKKSTS